MNVLVLGAGVVGVASAYFLARAGHAVTVIDRQPGPGLETSFANGGQVAVCHSRPWAAPETPLKALKWIGRSDSPLLWRLRFDADQWRWGLRFLRNCTAARVRINAERIIRVARYSRAQLKKLRAETGIAYDHLSRGILNVFRAPQDLDEAGRHARMVANMGLDLQVLNAGQCVAVEPALATSATTIVGGLLSPDDETGDAHKFTVALAALCAELGVQFRYATAIHRLRAGGDRVDRVETAGGDFRADAVVVALGSYSPMLLRPLGLRVPVYPAKGYSVTLPLDPTSLAPTVSIIDDEHKLVFSRLGDRLRVGGTAEFAGYDTTIDPSRARSVLDRALRLFPKAGDPARATFWTGLRPQTPDSVPIIGRTRFANLILNTGHGTLGWTMCCGAGRIVADLVSGRDPEIDLGGLGLDRFGD